MVQGNFPPNNRALTQEEYRFHFETYLEQHASIIQRCKGKDPEAAEHCMRMHIQTIKEVLIGHLNTFPGTAMN